MKDPISRGVLINKATNLIGHVNKSGFKNIKKREQVKALFVEQERGKKT
jgi:hypothetical protein